MVDTTTLGTDLPAENIPYNVSHIFISRGEESMNKTISTDQDFNLWVLLHQTKDAIFKAREKELSQYGITTMEAGVLFIIQAIGDKVTPAEISRWIFREHHTVSALLSRMEKKGLITKVKDVDRKNLWRVSLTEKGQNAYRQAAKRDSIYAALSPLLENERQLLESYLRKVRGQAIKYSISEQTPPFPPSQITYSSLKCQ